MKPWFDFSSYSREKEKLSAGEYRFLFRDIPEKSLVLKGDFVGAAAYEFEKHEIIHAAGHLQRWE